MISLGFIVEFVIHCNDFSAEFRFILSCFLMLLTLNNTNFSVSDAQRYRQSCECSRWISCVRPGMSKCQNYQCSGGVDLRFTPSIACLVRDWTGDLQCTPEISGCSVITITFNYIHLTSRVLGGSRLFQKVNVFVWFDCIRT